MEKHTYEITNLRIGQMETPLGIDLTNPVFSWQFHSKQPNMRQKKIRLTVTRERDGA